MRTRLLIPLTALACAALLAACSGGDDGTGASRSGKPGPGEYLPGLAAAVDTAENPRAVVVLLPGGAWAQIWDWEGFRALAQALAKEGVAVVQVAYSTAQTHTYYPRPADDVACAVAYAAQQVPGVPVVLVGHSAGAPLAVLTGLVPERDDPTCPYPAHAADGVVGLDGPYDISRSGIGENLFGVAESDDPDLWRDGSPATWVAERPELPFLLAHGGADEQVPVWFTEGMATALQDAGHPVTVEVLPGRLHNDMYRPDVVAPPILDWIDSAVLGGDS